VIWAIGREKTVLSRITTAARKRKDNAAEGAEKIVLSTKKRNQLAIRPNQRQLYTKSQGRKKASLFQSTITKGSSCCKDTQGVIGKEHDCPYRARGGLEQTTRLEERRIKD